MENKQISLLTSNSAPVPMPGPIPSPIPGMMINIDPVVLVNGILDCYKNVTIAKEEQLTLRNHIREQSRVYIAAIEANTKEFDLVLSQIKIERMEFVKLLCDTIRQESIDEYSLRLCEMILNYLRDTNPMYNAGKALQFSNIVLGMTGRKE